MEKVLIVEDDRSVCDLLELHLKDAGITVEKAFDGVRGLSLAQRGDYQLIILDLKLPAMDGLEVCKRLRLQRPFQLIAILTSRSDDVDKILGFEMGADDYITKPFNIREVVARVKALLRRAQRSDQSTASLIPIAVGKLHIDPGSRLVTLDSKPLELTATEFDLLYFFAAHRGRAFTRQQLLDCVWGYQFGGYEHTVNSHINRLRNKIEEDPSKPKLIETVWGVGYRMPA